MGESKRRKQLDPNWGKARLIEVTFKTCKELFRPRTKEGETALHWGIFNFYRTALENDAPGVTMFACSQGLPGTETEPWFQGTPVFMSSRFIALDALVDAKLPRLPIEDIRHLAEETDFSSDRITLIRFRTSGDGSDLLAVTPVAVIQEELKEYDPAQRCDRND